MMTSDRADRILRKRPFGGRLTNSERTRVRSRPCPSSSFPTRLAASAAAQLCSHGEFALNNFLECPSIGPERCTAPHRTASSRGLQRDSGQDERQARMRTAVGRDRRHRRQGALGVGWLQAPFRQLTTNWHRASRRVLRRTIAQEQNNGLTRCRTGSSTLHAPAEWGGTALMPEAPLDLGPAPWVDGSLTGNLHRCPHSSSRWRRVAATKTLTVSRGTPTSCASDRSLATRVAVRPQSRSSIQRKLRRLSWDFGRQANAA